MMQKLFLCLPWLVRLALIFMLSPTCLAGVTLTGTRIVFSEGQQEKVIRTSNKGTKPSLVQVWIDEGNTAVDGVNQETPFMAIPPLFRIEPGKGQSIRVRYLGQPLPTDKESIFWFNLLEIPPSTSTPLQAEQLSLAFRTRIKLFYRPKGLMSNSAEQGGALRWKLVTSGELVVTNPTPYFMSFQSIEVVTEGGMKDILAPMIAPFTEQKIKLPSGIAKQKIREIHYEVINDYGNGIGFKQNYTGGNQFTLIK